MPERTGCTRREAIRLAFFFGSGASLAAVAPAPCDAGTASGTFERPFCDESPWNIAPVQPVLGGYRLPPSRYHPFVGEGAYSTGVFLAGPGDPPVAIGGTPGSAGVWCVDDGVSRPVDLPHWPANVRPASGGDGHADIVDATTGLVHSFWQLRHDAGQWRATQYAWSRLDGRGWPDPAHNHQGARAAGVPTLGGLIRNAEAGDGEPIYRHVLAMSLPGAALRRGYVYPAAGEDDNAPDRYAGQVPIGSLMMLPADFEPALLHSGTLRKVARTLARYGARVVDQNLDTRFALYVENGTGFDLHEGGWNPAVADDLGRIADALRPVLSVSGWQTGDGRPVSPPARFNLLSMRGPWRLESGTARARFDSWRQALVFQAGDDVGIWVQSGGEGARQTRWAPWQPGRRYRLRVHASGGATLQLQLHSDDRRLVWDSGELGDGQVADVLLPGRPVVPFMRATGGRGAAAELAASFIEHPD